MDTYQNYVGYQPYAPAMGYGYGSGAYGSPDQPATQGDVPATAPVSASFGFSTNVAIAGWLAAIVVGLALYRFVWERSA